MPFGLAFDTKCVGCLGFNVFTVQGGSDGHSVDELLLDGLPFLVHLNFFQVSSIILISAWVYF